MLKRLLRRLPWVLLLAGLGAAVVWGFWPVPVDVETATVTRGPLEVAVEEDGITRIREKYVVFAPVSGNLLRIDWDAGDEVARDESVLARIAPGDSSLLDPRAVAEAEARLRAAEAAREQAAAGLVRAKEAAELAEHRFDRVRELHRSNTITRDAFDEAEHGLRIARADVRSEEFGLRVADFEIELAKAALSWTTPMTEDDAGTSVQSAGDPLLSIRAPVSGRVLRVLREDAGTVASGTPLVEIGEPRDLELVVDVLSTDAVRIDSGDLVHVRRWGGPHDLQAVVRLVEPAGFLEVSALGVEEQRVNVIADFVDTVEARGPLGDAYRIEARIVVESHPDVIRVPAGALFREGDEWFAFQVVDGRARRQQVEPGLSNGLETEIVRGLAVDDAVVLYPSDRIVDGVAVRTE